MVHTEQLIWRGVHALDATQVAADPAPGGLVLFARNLDPDPLTGPPRCRALVDDLRRRWSPSAPLAVAIDQEGGPVSRLKAWVGETPSFRQLWEAGGANSAEAWGRLWGEGLGLLGISVNFAPLVDLHDGIPGTGLGDRRASADPGEATEAAEAFLSGLEATGVRGCLKHFPGLGGTRVDSHHALPELTDATAIARAVAPFQRLAHADRLVMVAHVRTPWSEGLPASLHRAQVAGNPWGVSALWVTDDLEMGGCGAWPWPERIRRAVEAGHAGLLVCQSQEALDATRAALAELPEALLQDAIARSEAHRRKLGPLPPFGAEAWRDWVRRVGEASAPFVRP